MRYFINLFTAETWREIRTNANFEFTGHREAARNRSVVQPGDILLCYVTKVSAFVGALRVTSEVYEVEEEDPRTWASDLYPVRFRVELVARVPLASGVSLDDIRRRTDEAPLWKWVYRNSLNEIPATDAEWIFEQLNSTEPQLGSGDPEPELADELAIEDEEVAERRDTHHATIQGRLVTLGRDLGLDVWVAQNDRGVEYNGARLGDLSTEALPPGLPDDVRRRVALIDVIWLRRNSYVAAFEIEATTSILSGLARMGDLVALIPNLDLPFFIVAPDARRGKVFEQITRPLFALGLTRPLHRNCRFISFETLEADLDRLGHTTSALDPHRYLDSIAEEAP
ncbi:MAG: EVE domain-containing protein [Actinobacteria bacterium]|nr:EVE domain-containing protein [Actinomycetota bacterium]